MLGIKTRFSYKEHKRSKQNDEIRKRNLGEPFMLIVF